jgi:predicted dehydrogenase
LGGGAPRVERYDADKGYQASFDGVIAHFVDCLETGAAFETGPEDNLATLVLVDDAYKAAAARGRYASEGILERNLPRLAARD